MQAIILAGGFGTRLRTLTHDLPKPMISICNQPFLAYLLDYLKQQGFTQIIFSVHYRYEKIQEYFGTQYLAMKIAYAIENEPLGTGGAILNALQLLQEKKPVFVLNGDTFLQLNYQAMYAQHINNAAALTLALRKVNDCSRYGEIKLNHTNVSAFQYPGSAQPGFITAGIYVMSADLFTNYSLPQKFSFELNFLQPYISTLNVQAFITKNYFIDIGVPEDYLRAQHELPMLRLPT